MSEATSQIIEPCSACGQFIDVSDEAPFSEVICPNCGEAVRVRRQFNNFTLLELLGEGGMGSVFKAQDLNLRRLVALKILKKEAGSTESGLEKLAEEAQITATINHPHVVKVFSFGEDHGQFYLAMELVGKGSLDDLMNLQTSVAEAQVLTVGIQTAQGLQAAYEHGLIHRDVKPGNILFADAVTAKIVDFGLAVLLDAEAQERGEIWGTPYYIAPEKLDNRPEDFRSDIYSLGGTLFHALSGRPPFEANTASMVALKHIKSQAVSLQAFAPNVSSETAYVINRMLNKDPDERYQSYDELIGHLSYARQKLAERSAKPVVKKERVQVESEKSRAFAAAIWGATLVILLIGGGLLFAFRDKIFPGAAQTAQASPKTSLQEVNRMMAEGRAALIERNDAGAAERFGAAAVAAGERQPAKNWALASQGLAAMLAGNGEEAEGIFKGLQSAGLYSMKSEDQGLANFFVELGRLMSLSKGISKETGGLYSKKNYEAFALLCYGLKDWGLGEIGNAGPLLQAFDSAKPESPYGWISDLKPMAAPYLADYTIYAEFAKKAKKASAPELAGLAVRIDAAKPRTQTGTRIKEALDALKTARE